MDNKLVAKRVLRLFARALPIIPFPELFDLAAAITQSQTELDQQIAEAISSLQKSVSLISTLETEVRERGDRVSKLQEEQKKLTALSEITSEQVKALALQIETSIGRSKKWDWLTSLAINLVAGIIIFVIGIFSSDWVRNFATHFFS